MFPSRQVKEKRKANDAFRSSFFPVTAKVALHLQLIYCWSWTPSTKTSAFAGMVRLLTVFALLAARVYP